MGLPRQLGSGDSGSGYGPFGRKAFRGALVACVVLVVVGLLMVVLGGDAANDVGFSFIAMGTLGLATGTAGLLLERLSRRRPPPGGVEGNGRGSSTPDLSRVERP